MIKILSSKYLGYIVVVFALVALIFGYGQSQYSKGYQDRDVINQLEIARLNDVIRNKEKAWQAQARQIDEKHYEQLSEHKNTINQLNRNISNLNQRLHVKVKHPVCTSQTSKTSSVDDGTTRAELDGAVAQDIIGIIARGDQAIIQLNALQDWAEAVTAD